MNQLKKPLDFKEQVKRLRTLGMILDDEQKAEDILRKSNYYRFSGYALQFRVSPNQSDYVPGTNFDKIHQIYLFDEALRDICRRYIEIAEVYYRTQISYGFSISKCITPPLMINIITKNIFIIKTVIKRLWKISTKKKITTETI